MSSFKLLREEIISCTLCPRLVMYRETAPALPQYANEPYWRRPIPGFGDPNAWLLIVGLAPSAQGGNRTGRIFTGDKSAVFLMNALYATGFANKPTSVSSNDGLKLTDCYLTAAVKCVPPDNKPTPQECVNCSPYLQTEMRLLKNVTHVLALGKVALDGYILAARAQGHKVRTPKFAHGQRYELEGLPIVYASYHPSPQNTNTGKLSEESFVELLNTIRKEHFL